MIATEIKAPTPSRNRASQPKELISHRQEAPNGVLLSPGHKTRPRSCPVAPETSSSSNNNSQRAARRSLGHLSKLRSGEAVGARKGGEPEENRPHVGRAGNRVVEQYSRLRSRRADQPKREEDSEGKKKDLRLRMEESESLVKDLQSEVLSLKAQLEKLHNLNSELEAENSKFRADMAAAEAKISALSCDGQGNSLSTEMQYSGFRQSKKLIANKLDQFNRNKESAEADRLVVVSTVELEPAVKAAEVQSVVFSKVSPSTTPPPPPPPPLPRQPRAPAKTPPSPLASRQDPHETATVLKAPSLLEFYRSLTTLNNKKKDPQATVNCTLPVAVNAHNSIVGEIQSRSSHLLAVRSDVETKGDFINFLIQKIKSTAFTDVDELLAFVEWLDMELSSLSDERAVLRHFDWPEKKADAMREAAFEYRDLKRLIKEVSCYEDDLTTPCEITLRKMTSLLDKSEKSIHKLIKLRESSMQYYRDCKIPTEWMLNSGIISKIKLASVKLAKLYMKRVSLELESNRNSEKESTSQEVLLRQCVHFAYRAHQFAGGLDTDTMYAFEEIRQRVPAQWGGSPEMIAGMT